MPGSYLFAHLHVTDTTPLEFHEHSHRVLPALILGAAEGRIVLDLPLDPVSAERFLRRLAETAAHAAAHLTTGATPATENGS
jgi:hypothetical protein